MNYRSGNFTADRRAVQAAVYFYYCWSLARALAAAGVREILTEVGPDLLGRGSRRRVGSTSTARRMLGQ